MARARWRGRGRRGLGRDTPSLLPIGLAGATGVFDMAGEEDAADEAGVGETTIGADSSSNINSRSSNIISLSSSNTNSTDISGSCSSRSKYNSCHGSSSSSSSSSNHTSNNSTSAAAVVVVGAKHHSRGALEEEARRQGRQRKVCGRSWATGRR